MTPAIALPAASPTPSPEEGRPSSAPEAVKPRKRRRQRRAVRKTRPMMRHSQPRPGCQLCELEHSNEALVELWEAGRWPLERRRAVLSSLISDHGLGVDVEQVLEHHSRHRAPQPVPAGPRVLEQLDETAAWVARNPRRLEALRFVAQAKIATPTQVAELFWPGIPTGVRQARRTLRDAAHRHLVYRVFLSGWTKHEPTEVYALGRAGAELLSVLTTVSWDWAASPKAIAPSRVLHDSGVSEYLLAFRRSAGETTLAGKRFRTRVLPDNYWAIHLGVSATIPQHHDELGRTKGAVQRMVVPDGFVVVGVETIDQTPGVASSFALPAIVERDRGRRSRSETSEQIFGNLVASWGGTWLERFPELKGAPELRPPLLFILSSRRGDGVESLPNIKRGAEELCAKRIKIEPDGQHRSFRDVLKASPRAFLALDRDVRERGLEARVVPLFSEVQSVEDGPTILEALMTANLPLVKSGAIGSNQVLSIDTDGARWEPSKRGAKLAADSETLGSPEQRRIGESPAAKKRAQAEQLERETAVAEYEAEIRRIREGGEHRG